MKKVVSVPVVQYPGCSGLDAESASRYVLCENAQMPFLDRIIIKPFEEGLERIVNHELEGKPPEDDKKHERSVQVDGQNFRVAYGISQNRSSPKEVYEGLLFYLDKVRREHARDIRRSGVITQDAEPYIDTALVLDEIQERREFIKEEGLKITPRIDDGQLPQPTSFSAPLCDYSTLDSLAETYLLAKSLHEYDRKQIHEPFAHLLKQYTGYSSENIPPETTDSWHHDTGIAFKILSVPTHSVSYSAIIDGLIKKGKKVTHKSGELIKMQEGWEDEYTARCRHIRRGDAVLVNVGDLYHRMGDLKKENTTPRLKQTIYPITNMVLQEW